MAFKYFDQGNSKSGIQASVLRIASYVTGMAAKLGQQRQVSFRVPGHLSGSSVTVGSPQTQLLFNRGLPASASNRATRVTSPSPIVIEKLGPKVEAAVNDGEASTCSSMCFSVLSEERLEAAVRLAKRDLRRRRLESIRSPTLQQEQEEEIQKTGSVEHRLNQHVSKGKVKAANPNKEVTKSGARVKVYSPQKLALPPRPPHGQSLPTRDFDPGTEVRNQEPDLSREIHRLQKELGSYIQKVEQLADKERLLVEPLEPEEERRLKIRRQEQAARSARIIYTLQRQGKAVDRLAAAHRGAVRAMQVFVSQLSDQSANWIPSHYKELGQLIRQLSLCSAKMEVGKGSSVPKTTIDILHQLEKSPRERRHSASPPRATGKVQQPHRPIPVKKRFPGESASTERDNCAVDAYISPRLSTAQQPASPRECPAAQQESVQQDLDPDKMRQARNETLRQAWLEKKTTQRLKELNQLSRQEAEHILKLRSQVPSPTSWAESAERAAREKLRPLLDHAQEISDLYNWKGTSLRHRLSKQAAEKAAASADLLSEAILEELLEDTAQALWAVERDNQIEELAEQQLQGPTLESMLFRMEEMERDQDAVRQRFAHISYSDPQYWAAEERAGPPRAAPGCIPGSPRPMRLTKPALRQEPAVDILLVNPVEI
ncbi:hypothetical protein Z043_101914, partial [Scleropages formosus]